MGPYELRGFSLESTDHSRCSARAGPSSSHAQCGTSGTHLLHTLHYVARAIHYTQEYIHYINFTRQTLKDPAPGTPSIAYPPEVLRAIQQAKEANNNVAVAQHKVADAKQAALIQQKIALAKEAAAREAAARYTNN